jgi:hypothetical protein
MSQIVFIALNISGIFDPDDTIAALFFIGKHNANLLANDPDATVLLTDSPEKIKQSYIVAMDSHLESLHAENIVEGEKKIVADEIELINALLIDSTSDQRILIFEILNPDILP